MKRLELQLQKNAVRADLIVLPLPEFDIILGMDWLSMNGAIIDFLPRSVSDRPHSGKPFIFEIARHQQMPHIISCICTRKLMKRGCQAFLASIVTVIKPVNQRLEEVKVVEDFPSVFLDDVLGIPPDRELDFSIDLMSGTVPISKEPYHLAPAEIKELKDQIQYFLDKGFICPRFSPWGAPGSWELKLPLVDFTYHKSYQKSIGMAPYEALYGRKCRSPVYWDDVGERAELGPDIFSQTIELVVKIRDRMRTTQSRQKSYVDERGRDLEFAVRDHVFVKVAPIKGVMRFGKKGKLSPRFIVPFDLIVPFEILETVGTLGYRVALLPNLVGVHTVFHVSMLRKYMSNPSHVLNYEPL
ncbi:uncharacterized protein LOC142519654 [Primulina tabacum]|uniref:uncharacterized protein LOC142519654 n=1 Tax=Primulina tabacum TaxID=48773 RepID=UPI003F592652